MAFMDLLYARSVANTSIFGKSGVAPPASKEGATLRPGSSKTLTEGFGKGYRVMAAGDEAAAAILVQTIFLKDGHLQGLLGEQANKSPMAAAEFLKPFYRAVLTMVSKAKAEA
jgi:hypothetical protein